MTILPVDLLITDNNLISVTGYLELSKYCQHFHMFLGLLDPSHNLYHNLSMVHLFCKKDGNTSSLSRLCCRSTIVGNFVSELKSRQKPFYANPEAKLDLLEVYITCAELKYWTRLVGKRQLNS